MEKIINLLLIDDDEVYSFIVKKMIDFAAFSVNIISKSDGQLALEFLNQLMTENKKLPDMIILDINMPIMNGWEFLTASDSLCSKLEMPIYILSSSVFEDDINKALLSPNVKGFISKPISRELLAQLFTKVTNNDKEYLS